MINGFATRGVLVPLATLLLTIACSAGDAAGPRQPPATAAPVAPPSVFTTASLDPNVAATIKTRS